MPSETHEIKALLSSFCASRGLGDPIRVRVLECLSNFARIDEASILVAHISDLNDLESEIQAGVAKNPAIFILSFEDLLESLVLEEIETLQASVSSRVIVTVVQGEGVRIQIHGPNSHLRNALDTIATEPTKTSEGAIEGLIGEWAEWTYLEWNTKLIDYCFGIRKEGTDFPVERLPATPEEMSRIAGASSALSSEVTEKFVSTCVKAVAEGNGFNRFGKNFKWGSDYVIPWNPTSDREPHFFAILWLTSLICYGFPDAQGTFHDRLKRLFGRSINPKSLPELWEAFAEWTSFNNQSGRGIRELILPPKDGFRKTIGRSYFLAFPHREDRRWLSRVLISADLKGSRDLPIRPVLRVLQQNKSRFSSQFKEDFQKFKEQFIEVGGDVRNSAFWRAIRQAGMEVDDCQLPKRQGKTMLLALFEDYEFIPFIGCRSDWKPPSGFASESMGETAIAEWDHFVKKETGEFRELAESELLQKSKLLGPWMRAMIKRGVLIFQEDHENDYYLVDGAEISGADTALVKDEFIQAFTSIFGGRSESSQIDGWNLVQDCKIHQLDEPPPELESVHVLQRTMLPPTARFVGGVRLSQGEYLAIEGLLPAIRAINASNVQVRCGNGEFLSCRFNQGDTIWELPSKIASYGTVRIDVLVEWANSESAFSFSNEKCFQLREIGVQDDYKSSPSGYFFRESCHPAQASIEGGDTHPLDISQESYSSACDLLQFEPSLRWLGPGLGEMSLTERDDFDWVAIGPKKSPEALLFIGNPDNPRNVEDRQSRIKSDKSHWRCAFNKAKNVYVRDSKGGWEPLDSDRHLKVAEALGKHRSRINCAPHADLVQGIGLETMRDFKIARHFSLEDCDPVLRIVEALACLSVNRKGLRYKTVQEIFSEITGCSDFRLHNELIRAWCEQGCLDLLRDQRYARSILMARRPRFVAFHRGPLVSATLVGLVTHVRWNEVIDSFSQCESSTLFQVEPVCRWQPRLLRVRTNKAELSLAAKQLGLNPTEWLTWDTNGSIPDSFDVSLENQQLKEGAYPMGYSRERTWDWELSEFVKHGPEQEMAVEIEQLFKDGEPRIWAVRQDGEVEYWTYIRNWALLAGSELAGRPPFSIDVNGQVNNLGKTPIHLPMPLARICSIAGDAPPGPNLDVTGEAVESYSYVFGKRLTDVVSRAIPDTWKQD